MRRRVITLGAVVSIAMGMLGASSTPPIYANQPGDKLEVEVAPVKIPRAYGRVVGELRGYLVFEATDGTIRLLNPLEFRRDVDRPFVHQFNRD